LRSQDLLYWQLVLLEHFPEPYQEILFMHQTEPRI